MRLHTFTQVYLHPLTDIEESLSELTESFGRLGFESRSTASIEVMVQNTGGSQWVTTSMWVFRSDTGTEIQLTRYGLSTVDTDLSVLQYLHKSSHF